jgi:hypothetical protein
MNPPTTVSDCILQRYHVKAECQVCRRPQFLNLHDIEASGHGDEPIATLSWKLYCATCVSFGTKHLQLVKF